MKSSVKLPPSNKIKKNLKSVPSKKKVETISIKTPVKKEKNIRFAKVKHSTKRYGKQLVKNMLLSKLFHIVFKVMVGILFFGIVSYLLYGYFNRTLANDIVVSKSEIVDRVAKLTSLPKGNPDAIVRVEDPEALKKQNSFYEDVKIGDYIVMYPKLAVIYDLRNNSIVAIKKTEEK